MKLVYLTSFLLTTILLTGCELFMEKWYYIYIKNNSNITLFVTAGQELYKMKPYPDTLLPYKKPGNEIISPNNRNNLISSHKWEDVISSLPSDTLSIYFLDADTVNICGWEEVAKDYKVLKRYDFSVDDLKNMNWTVTYP
jgi:hypothetical protein